MQILLVYIRMMRVLQAYIDPGTGTLIVQALIAAIVAVPLFFRHQIARFARLARGGARDDRDGSDDTAESAGTR